MHHFWTKEQQQLKPCKCASGQDSYPENAEGVTIIDSSIHLQSTSSSSPTQRCLLHVCMFVLLLSPCPSGKCHLSRAEIAFSGPSLSHTHIASTFSPFFSHSSGITRIRGKRFSSHRLLTHRLEKSLEPGQ